VDSSVTNDLNTKGASFDNFDFNDIFAGETIGPSPSVETRRNSNFSYATPASDSPISSNIGEYASIIHNQLPGIGNMMLGMSQKDASLGDSQSESYDFGINAFEAVAVPHSSTASSISASPRTPYTPYGDDMNATFHGLDEFRRTNGGQETPVQFSKMTQYQLPSPDTIRTSRSGSSRPLQQATPARTNPRGSISLIAKKRVSGRYPGSGWN